jgi:SPOR domain
MAAVNVGYARRRADARKAKEKRQKRILTVGIVLLLGVMAFQGQKLMNRTRGVDATPAEAVPAPGGLTLAPRGKVTAADRAAAAALGAKDPFVAQVREGGSSFDPPTPIAGPSVRQAAFVSKDPFVQQVVVGGAVPAQAGDTSGGPVANAKGKYIVVLASIPLSGGRGMASRYASKAKSAGVRNVGVLKSSSYATLRSGFYVVYAGPFASLKDTLAALGQARSQGFVTSYSRRLGK